MLRGRGAEKFTGVLGWPLEHTLSPPIHNAGFRRLGLDWIYLPFRVPPEMLEGAVLGLRALGARGANVTMPHKETVLGFLDDLSGDAREVGAVNTIQEIGGKLVGHNTDIDGFRGFLEADAGFSARDKRALVLGAGGAARAVVRALGDMDAAEVTVAARDRDAAEPLSALARATRVVEWGEAAALTAEAELVVNATPLGMRGEDPVPEAAFRTGQTVVDLIYHPPTTPLLERARSSGAYAWGGLGMLVHQAVAAFRIWTGQEPPVEVMSAAAVHALGHWPHPSPEM